MGSEDGAPELGTDEATVISFGIIFEGAAFPPLSVVAESTMFVFEPFVADGVPPPSDILIERSIPPEVPNNDGKG